MANTPNTKFRPPIVAVLGHVDHGKTTLLDTIRKANVAAKEHGGITQHIGAYQINFQDHLITFIDTPGHAAFEKMRSRGAEVADIAILVVAANDGVKPQTDEAIKHIKRAQTPIILAITKTDLPNVNIEKVKSQLQAKDVVVENYGGDVPTVEVSAPKNKGINELLEVIMLVWQLKPEPNLENDPLQAVVVESFVDKNKGPVVSVIVKAGTLKVGQKISVDSEPISVKALVDDNGKNVKEAPPSKPVEILGFKKALEVGSVITELYITREKEAQKAISFEDIIKKAETSKESFKVIIKADVSGSLEAILANLPRKILVVSSEVGQVQEKDVSFAKVANAPILAFNTKVAPSVKSQADRENVIIRSYNVIYELLDDLTAVSEGFQEAKREQKVTGRAKVVAIFEIEGQKIAGSMVTHGKLKKGEKVIVKTEEGTKEQETTVSNIKRFKKDVELVSSGQECGIAFSDNVDLNVGYIIESLG